MKELALFSVLFMLMMASMAQNSLEQDKSDEQIIVNKEYDEDGNLIGYDSTFIQKWSSDTTFNYNFDNRFLSGEGFPDMNLFFKEFFNDSLKNGFIMPHHLKSSPFNDEGFFSEFENMFTDSAFLKPNPDSLNNLHRNFSFPDLRIMEDQMKQHFRNHDFQNFQNKEHKEEWEKLIKKHQQELKDLKEKWQSINE